MDLENQKRVKEFYDQYGKDDLIVLLGAAEGEAAGPGSRNGHSWRSYLCRPIGRSLVGTFRISRMRA